MKIEIRKATIEDFGVIRGLNQCLFKKEYKEYDKTLDCKWPFSKEGIKFFKDAIIRKDYAAFVAVKDDEIVGYLTGAIGAPPNWRNVKKFAELWNMFIIKQYRNHGIGTKLCKEFFKWCKNKKVTRVAVKSMALNKETIDFYMKNGFNEYELILEKTL